MNLLQERMKIRWRNQELKWWYLICISISDFFMQCHLGKTTYNPAILSNSGALIKKKNKCNTKQHETCHRAARHKNFLFWTQTKMWKKWLCVVMLLQSDSSVPKATSNALRCWHEGKEKSKSSIPVCIWELVQWCWKLSCFDCSNYWCYKYSCSRLHIQKGSIMGKKEKKNKQTKEKTTKPATPLTPQSNITLVWTWEVLFQ